MSLLTADINSAVSVYCEHTVANGILTHETEQGILLEKVRFRMRMSHSPAKSAKAEIGATWEQPWAVIPWAKIDYIGPPEPE